MPKYRIIESYLGTPTKIYSRFNADNDIAAAIILRTERKKLTNKYSYLWLEQIIENQNETVVNIPVKD